jgi:hypothetical protein
MKLRRNCRTATGKQENRKTGKQENRKTGKQENRKTGKQDDAFGERAKADGANTDSSGMPAKMTMAVRQRID